MQEDGQCFIQQHWEQLFALLLTKGMMLIQPNPPRRAGHSWERTFVFVSQSAGVLFLALSEWCQVIKHEYRIRRTGGQTQSLFSHKLSLHHDVHNSISLEYNLDQCFEKHLFFNHFKLQYGLCVWFGFSSFGQYGNITQWCSVGVIFNSLSNLWVSLF